jgi:hypothetical protein
MLQPLFDAHVNFGCQTETQPIDRCAQDAIGFGVEQLLPTHNGETGGFLGITVLRVVNAIDLAATRCTCHGMLLGVPGRLEFCALVSLGIQFLRMPIEGYSGMRVIGLDPATGFFTVSQQVDSNWANVRACDVADVYGIGVDSVLFGTATLYDPYFTAFDFASSVRQWSSPHLSGGGAAVTHADVNGDGVPDLIGITNDGHLYAWDVRGQTLIWSMSGIGAGVDVAVGDVYGDGRQEIVVLTTTQVLVFTQSPTGITQKASYSVTGSDLLVADTKGAGKAEVYVLASSFGSSNASVYEFDGSLTLLNSYPVASAGASASSLYLENSAFPQEHRGSLGPQLLLIHGRPDARSHRPVERDADLGIAPFARLSATQQSELL